MAVPVTSTLFRFIFLHLFIIQTLDHFLAAATVLQSHIKRRLIDQPSGFISLDCGLEAGSYINFPPNGLNYTSDEKYISSGKKSEISATYYNSLSNYTNHPLYVTLRSFPEGRRNCYKLWPVEPNNKYLIRTGFMYGNYDGKNVIPQFDVYIGVHFWFTISLQSAGYLGYQEIIHVATSESIDFCLVNTALGTPFINILELRPLDITSPYPASPAFSLSVHVHEMLAVIVLQQEAPDWKVINTTNESFVDSQTNICCKVPTSVLMTAGEQNNGLPNMTLLYAVKDPTTQFYVYWHFAELEVLGSNDTREFYIYVSNGPGYKYLQVTTIESPRISVNGSSALEYALIKTKESSHYPILNAIDAYTELPNSPTNQEDVDAVATIKNKYAGPRIWQGDPCLPIYYQWDGLNCTFDVTVGVGSKSNLSNSSQVLESSPMSLLSAR